MNYSEQCTGYYTSNTDPLKMPWSTRIHVLPRALLNLRQPLKCFSSHCYSDFSVQYHFKGAEWLGDFRRGCAGNMRKIQHVITTLQWVYTPLNWTHSKHPKLHLWVSSTLAAGYQLSPTIPPVLVVADLAATCPVRGAVSPTYDPSPPL